MLYDNEITTTDEVYNLPEGQEVQIHTDADITIAFWNPRLKAYGPEIDILAPGNFVGVGHNKARLTGAANVRIL
jgi:hypothetical protein